MQKCFRCGGDAGNEIRRGDIIVVNTNGETIITPVMCSCCYRSLIGWVLQKEGPDLSVNINIVGNEIIDMSGLAYEDILGIRDQLDAVWLGYA